MELLDRYLQAVGQYLPAETRDDTLAELRANLLDQMDGRAEELGRALTEGEVAAILKAHGKPEVVAVRYLPQRSLIGPAVFPFYVMTLRRALPFVVLIYIVVSGTLFALSPRTTSVSAAMVQIWSQFVPVLSTFLCVVTAIFAAIEYGHRRLNWPVPGDDWDPRKLPPLAADARKPTRTSRIAGMIAQWFAVAYLLAIPNHPFLVLGPVAASLAQAGVIAAPVWHTFYWWLVGGMVIQLGLRLMDLGRQPRVVAGLLAKAISVVLLATIVVARVYFVSTNGWVALGVLNAGLGIWLRIMLVFTGADLGWAVWKAVRDRAPIPTVAGRVSL